MTAKHHSDANDPGRGCDGLGPLSEAEIISRGGWVTARALISRSGQLSSLDQQEGEGDQSVGVAIPQSCDEAENKPHQHSGVQGTECATSRRKHFDARRKARERERLKEESKIGQLNVMTSVEPAHRSALRSLAEALMPEKPDADAVAAAVRMLAGDPSLARLLIRANATAEIRSAVESASETPELVARGRVTAHESVRSSIDALLGEPDLCNLVSVMVHENSVGSACSNHIPLLSLLTDPELQALLVAIVSDTFLRRLVLSLCTQPTLRKAAEAVHTSKKISSIATRLFERAADRADDVSAVLDCPQALSVARVVAAQPAIREAVEAAIYRPDIVTIGMRLFHATGLRGWIARKMMRV